MSLQTKFEHIEPLNTLNQESKLTINAIVCNFDSNTTIYFLLHCSLHYCKATTLICSIKLKAWSLGVCLRCGCLVCRDTGHRLKYIRKWGPPLQKRTPFETVSSGHFRNLKFVNLDYYRSSLAWYFSRLAHCTLMSFRTHIQITVGVSVARGNIDTGNILVLINLQWILIDQLCKSWHRCPWYFFDLQ